MFSLALSPQSIQFTGLEIVYVLTGLVLAIFAVITFLDPHHPHPLGSGSFWLILAALFAFGSWLPHIISGILVLAMVAIDGAGRVKAGAAERARHHEAPDANAVQKSEAHQESRVGNRIFWPVLTIPLVTILFAMIYRFQNLDVTNGALVGLGLGGLLAMVVAIALTRASVATMMHDGRRLNECMGSVNILPQLLASLGVIFAAAGVGQVVAHAIIAVVPQNQLFLMILANCLGMSLFTMVMGNSFAAFPVIAAGVLIPLIVAPLGVDPAMAGIITLTAGSSGTLITPMAANFNIVPAALLELKNPYAVLKFQLPFALIIWPLHVLLMWGLIRMG